MLAPGGRQEKGPGRGSAPRGRAPRRNTGTGSPNAWDPDEESEILVGLQWEARLLSSRDARAPAGTPGYPAPPRNLALPELDAERLLFTTGRKSQGRFRRGNMAAAVPDSRVSAGKKPKTSLKKKKKKIKMVARAVASELKDEDKDAGDIGGNVLGLSAGFLGKGQAEVAGSRESQCGCRSPPARHGVLRATLAR